MEVRSSNWRGNLVWDWTKTKNMKRERGHLYFLGNDGQAAFDLCVCVCVKLYCYLEIQLKI